MGYSKHSAEQRAAWRAAYHRARAAGYRRPPRWRWREQRKPLTEEERLRKNAHDRARRWALGINKPRSKRTPAEIKAAQKAWRLANADRFHALQKAWRERNRDKRKARKKLRTKRLREWLRMRQNNRCAICGQRLPKAVHIDHIIPIKLGGSNVRSNLQLTHPSCNLAKHAHHPIDYAQRALGRLL